MLVELSMRNFALIPALTISFDSGLNVLSGETGAGKSMIVEAINLLMGGRASAEFIRHGQQSAEIEGLFTLPEDHPVHALLLDLGIKAEEGMLILRRDLSVKGKNVCRINGKLVTLSALREVGRLLLNIHGQHQSQQLLYEENYLPLLDEYGSEQIYSHKEEYKQLFERLRKVNRSLKQLSENEKQLAQRADLLRYQLKEIAAAELVPGEDEQLEQEKRVKSAAHKLHEGMVRVINHLVSEGRALDFLAEAMYELKQCAEIDESLHSLEETISTCYYQLEDLASQCRKYAEEIDADPDRLNQIESRLAQIDQLKRKYGQTVEEILVYAASVEDELSTLENKEEHLDRLARQKREILLDLAVEAEQLSLVRQKIAKQLADAVRKELADLYMEQTEIKIAFSPLNTGVDQVEHQGVTRWINQEGWDQIDWLIAPNPGEPPKSLSKIASGGELSRLQLAIKAVLAKLEPVTCLIFDEIDTGVSGRVAQAMADKLYMISLDRQVICITHQPQLAAMADRHLYIKKESDGKETMTTVIPLQPEQRRDELARMISGYKLTEATKAHVQELIEQAEQVKNQLRKA